MKKQILSLAIIAILIFYGCEPKQPTAPVMDIRISTLVLSKMVAVGNSLTAGFQSSGLVEDFQLHSYPYLIAQKMGMADEFQQPLIASPGIGSPAGKTPMSFNPATGEITQDNLTIPPQTLLKNALLPRGYDNLGVPGADVYDIYNTTSGATSGNAFFDLVLRNPNFGNTTQLEQAIGLRPTLLLLWIGSNDVLGAALAGGDLAQITSQTDFQTRYTAVLQEIQKYLTSTALVIGNVPNVTDIPYVNILDGAMVDLGAGEVPVLFGHDFLPIDFAQGVGNPIYLPLLTEETSVEHVLLTGVLAYQQGFGIPDSAAMVNLLGLPPGQASQLQAGMIAAGLNPTGQALPGSMTITVDEESALTAAVTGYNAFLTNVATTYHIPLIPFDQILAAMKDTPEGKFVLVEPAKTAFSLDGVHPNNKGNAIIANAFIDGINGILTTVDPGGVTLTKYDPADFEGQYLPKRQAKLRINESIESVKSIFVK
jgi:lysophospholipase L1-like esterase